MSNEIQKEAPVTPEYLLSHGFEQYTEEAAQEIYDMPFEHNEGIQHFREIEFHRQMFVVMFCWHNYDPKQGYGADVYVQHNAGCGFINIPFPWWDLTIEYFEAVYYGIRGHKPKRTIPIGEDADFEVIQPKKIENENAKESRNRTGVCPLYAA